MWPQYTTLNLVARLQTLNTTFYPGVESPSMLKLYKNDITPDANSIADQFEEADFVGYADVALAMGSVSLDAANIPVSQSNICHFQPSNAVNPNLIYGIFILADSGILIAAERFELPVPMNNALAAISGVWRTMEPSSNYGWLSVL